MRSLLSGIAGIFCMWLSSLCCMFAFISGFALLIGLLRFLFVQDLSPLVFAALIGLLLSGVVGYATLGLAKALLKDDGIVMPKWLRLSTWQVGALIALLLFCCGLAWQLQ